MITSCTYVLALWLTFVQGGFVYSSIFSQLEYKPNHKVNSYLVGDYAPYFNLLRENVRSAITPNPTGKLGILLNNYRLAIHQSAENGRIPTTQNREDVEKLIQITDDLASDAGNVILHLKTQNDTAGVILKTEELVEILRHRVHQSFVKIGAMFLVGVANLIQASLAVFAENILIPSNINWVPRPTNFFIKDDTYQKVRVPYDIGYFIDLRLHNIQDRITLRPNSTLAKVLCDVFWNRLVQEYYRTLSAASGGLFPKTLFRLRESLSMDLLNYYFKEDRTEVYLRQTFFKLHFGIYLADKWKNIKTFWEEEQYKNVSDPDTLNIIRKLESGYPKEFFEQLYQELRRYAWIKEVADCAAVTKNREFLKFFRQSEGPADFQRKLLLLRQKISYGISLTMYELGRELFTQRVFPFAKEYSLLVPPPPKFTNSSWSASHGYEFAIGMLEGFEGHLQRIKQFHGWINTTLQLTWSYVQIQEDIINILEERNVMLQMKIEDGPLDLHALVMDDVEVEIKARDPTLNLQFQRLLNCYRINLKHRGYSSFKADKKVYILVSTEWAAWHSFPPSAGDSPSLQTLRDGKLLLSPFTTWELELTRGACGSHGDLVALLKGQELDIFLNIKEGRHVSQNTDWTSLQLEDYYQEILLY